MRTTGKHFRHPSAWRTSLRAQIPSTTYVLFCAPSFAPSASSKDLILAAHPSGPQPPSRHATPVSFLALTRPKIGKTKGFVSPNETKRFASAPQVIEIIEGAESAISRNRLFSMAWPSFRFAILVAIPFSRFKSPNPARERFCVRGSKAPFCYSEALYAIFCFLARYFSGYFLSLTERPCDVRNVSTSRFRSGTPVR